MLKKAELTLSLNSHGQTSITIFINFVDPCVLDATCIYQVSRSLAFWFWRNKIFYNIWEWWPSWSCDQEHLYQLLFPQATEVPQMNKRAMMAR